jgi:hypothetical protein
MYPILPVVPVLSLIFVWLARPPWKTGLAISVLTLAAVVCAVEVIQWQRIYLEGDLPQFYQSNFRKAGITDQQAAAISSSISYQSYSMNIELQFLMALGLCFPVILSGVVLGGLRRPPERPEARAAVERAEA